MKIKIFYVLPSYNESENIKPLLKSFDKFYKRKKTSIFIILVNDGSTDNTLSIISNIKKRISKKN